VGSSLYGIQCTLQDFESFGIRGTSHNFNYITVTIFFVIPKCGAKRRLVMHAEHETSVQIVQEFYEQCRSVRISWHMHSL